MGSLSRAGLAALVPTVAWTAPPGAEPGATVTVSAEAQPVVVTRTPAPVRILEAEDLARAGVRTLAEVLDLLQPGTVMATGGPGAQASAFLNGTLSRNLVVLLDGMRLNDPTALSPDLGALGLVGIERVEVVLGPASVLYGSDAIGGVIALTSVGRGAPGAHGRAALTSGTDALAGAGARVQVTAGRAWLSAGGEARRQASSFAGDAFHQAGGFLRAGASLDALDLTAFYRNSGQTAALPFTVTGWPARREYRPDRETAARQEAWGGTATWTPAPALRLETTLQVLSGATGDPLALGPREQVRRQFRRVEDQVTLHWTPAPALRLSARLEGRSDASRARNYYDPSTYAAVPYRGEGRDLAAALEARWTLAEGLDALAGLRRDGGHRDLSRDDGGGRTRAGSAEAGTWRAGLNWRADRALRLYASAGTGFRMPNTTEFALNAQAEGLDRQAYPIRPERSRTLQAGASGLLGEHWEYRLEAQRTRLEQLLDYVWDDSFAWPPAFTSHYVNRGAVRAQGLEAALGWRTGGRVAWGWEAVLRSQETRDLVYNTPDQRFGGEHNYAILRHPFLTGGASAFVQAGAWRADLRLQRVGPRYDLSDTGAGAPASGVIALRRPFRDLALGCTFTPRPGLALALRGEHLLQPRPSAADWLAGRQDQDGDARLVYGFPAPGRRLLLTATRTW